MEYITSILNDTDLWQQVNDWYCSLPPEKYAVQVAGKCKLFTAELRNELGHDNPEFNPAHPIGWTNYNAFHSYTIANPEGEIAINPENDIIIDATIGQFIYSEKPYIGRRKDLKRKLENAFCNNQFDPGFIECFLGRKRIKSGSFFDIFFRSFYGNDSLHGISNKPLPRTLQSRSSGLQFEIY